MRLEAVERMETRIFCDDKPVLHTDSVHDPESTVNEAHEGLVLVDGDEDEVDSRRDRANVMARINAIVGETYEGRDLEIIRACL